MGVYGIGLIAHVGAGKTSLAEAMLHAAGRLPEMGLIEQGTTALDAEPEEKSRQSSTQAHLAWLDWEGQRLELIDTPGSANFLAGTVGATRVIDGAVMLASAEPGIQSQTDQLMEYLDKHEVPRLMVINKMDREQANFGKRLHVLNTELGNRFIPIELPWGEADKFQGIIDLVELKAFDYTIPDKPKAVEIPAALAAAVQEARAKLIERAAEGDDKLTERYLENETLTQEELLQGLTLGTQAGKFIPVLCAAATKNIGTDRVLHAIVKLLPDFERRVAMLKDHDSAPEGFVPDTFNSHDFAGIVFKTKLDHYAGKLSIVRVRSGVLKAGDEVFNPSANTSERPAHLFKLTGKEQKEVPELKAGEIGALPKLASVHTGHTLCSPKHKVHFAPVEFPEPVLTYAIKLSGKGEEDKLSQALHRMQEEDPTLSSRHNPETGDFLVSGMGQLHLDLVLERLNKEHNAGAEFELPKVPYRETIRAVSKAQGRHKKQSGGRGQYGDCWLELKPNGQSDHLTFKNAVVGGSIPRNFIPAIEKGIQEALHKGVVAGYPVIGIDVTVYDGSYHDVDSSEMAFKIAGALAFRKAMESARPMLLEPILEIEIIVHQEHLGDVMGDINSRRGRVLGMDTRGDKQVVRAEIPQAEALRYAIDLRAITSGQGRFTQKFARYQEVPAQIAEKVIAASPHAHHAEPQ
jgi:elongation factor G